MKDETSKIRQTNAPFKHTFEQFLKYFECLRFRWLQQNGRVLPERVRLEHPWNYYLRQGA